VPTRPFDHPRANRPATRQVLVIRQRGAVTTGVAHRPPHRLPLRHRACGGLPLSLQRRDDGAGLPGQQWLQVRAYPGQALGMGLPQQRVGRVPRLLGGVAEIEHSGVLRKGPHHLLCQRLCAIRERHALLAGGYAGMGSWDREP
jgi:hypothetical protein